MSKQPKGKYELDDYAGVMIAFREWCEANELNFRAEVAAWATRRMAGKDAPAQAAGPAGDPAALARAVCAELGRLLVASAAGAVAPAEVTAPPSAAGTGRPRGRLVASDDLPGRVFTHAEIREMCGLGPTTPISAYIAKGQRVGGKYRLRYATLAEIAAAQGTPFAGAPAAAPPPEPEPGPGPQSSPAPEGAARADDDAPRVSGWECAACFTQYPHPAVLPPRKCKRCGSARFRRAREYAAASSGPCWRSAACGSPSTAAP